MKLVPVGKVETDRVDRRCRGGGYDEFKTGVLVEDCQWPDGTPLYAIPPGYVVVHKAQLAEAREVIASLYAKTGYCDENLYKSMDLIDRAMTAQGGQ